MAPMSERTVEWGDEWVTAPIGPERRLRAARSAVESDDWPGAVQLLVAIARDAPRRAATRARRGVVRALRALVALATATLGAEALRRLLRPVDGHVAPDPALLAATLVVAPGAPSLTR